MPNMELGPVRPVGAVDTRTAGRAGGSAVRAERMEKPVPTVVKSDALDPGEAPVDAERIALIREAVETGSYPVVPTKIADALIAAGMLLRNGK